MNKAYSQLLPRTFDPLPLGAIQPRGWLRNQLWIQANGLSGHLDEFWPDLGPDNMWLGGNSEGWERGPYFVDGLLPLAHLLGNDRLKSKADTWIEAFLSSQDESGWIGPVQAPKRRAYDQWPNMIVLKVLTQFHEVSGDDRVIDVMTRFCAWLRDNLAEHPLFQWGGVRWADLALSIHCLYERTNEEWLLDVAAQLHEQGYDWATHFTDFQWKEKLQRDQCGQMETHVVNNAMGVKQPGVWYRQSKNEFDREGVYQALRMLDRYHGQVTGIFSGDEHYAGKDPSQGTELCAVVEFMFSLEHLIAILGDPELADRLERVAFNALPATFSHDMWSHQYDQQVNQVLCSIDESRHWSNNGPDANTFGLEPNFGCCTANMHQGWPKFAAHLWMATPDGGLAAAAYAPSEVTFSTNGTNATIVEDTDYPFRDTVRLRVRPESPAAFPLLLRIPGWASGATVDINGEHEAAPPPGQFFRVEREWQSADLIELRLPMTVAATRRYHKSVSIERGPLVYSLPIGEGWRPLESRSPHGDWEVHPTTPWNYGLRIDPKHPCEGVDVEERPVSHCPFSPEGAPVRLTVHGQRVPKWLLEHGATGPLPESPVESEEWEEELTLIPYGCTNLRVTEFPLIRKP